MTDTPQVETTEEEIIQSDLRGNEWMSAIGEKTSEEIFDLTIHSGIQYAKSEITRKYNENSNSRKEYHDINHTNELSSRGITILDQLDQKGIPISDRSKKIFELMAAYHDLDQDSGQDNEKNSADAAVTLLKKVNDLSEKAGKGKIFQEDEIDTIEKGILVTKADWIKVQDEAGEYATVKQHNLKNSDNILVVVMAVSDICTSGMEPEKYTRDGVTLFKEVMVKNQDLTYDQLSELAPRWFLSQVTFAKGRKIEFIKDIEDTAVPTEVKQTLQEILPQSNFDKSIEYAKVKAKKVLSKVEELNSMPDSVDRKTELETLIYDEDSSHFIES